MELYPFVIGESVQVSQRSSVIHKGMEPDPYP